MRIGIRGKLLASCLAVLAPLYLVGAVGWRNTTQFATDFHSLYVDRLQPAIQLNAAMQGLYELNAGAQRYGEVDPIVRAEIRRDEAAWLQKIDRNIATYAGTYLVAEEKSGLEQWNKSYPAFISARTRMLALDDAGDGAGADIVRRSEAPAQFGDAIKTLSALIEVQDRVGAQTNASVSAAADQAEVLLIVVIALATAAGATVSFLLARSMGRAVGAVAAAARRIAADDLPAMAATVRAIAGGDLTAQVDLHAERVAAGGRDELGEMAASFNAMIDQLEQTGAAFAQMTAGLGELVGGVQQAAAELTNTSDQLSASAGQAAVAVQQVTGAVQSIAGGAQETSSNAQASNEAVEAMAVAVEGIARGASEQSGQVQGAVTSAMQMATDVDAVATGAGAVAVASEQARAAAGAGAQAVQAAVEGMGRIKQAVDGAAITVADLGRLGEQIGAVVETIDDIAEQTNLLALNAAIEAARAGEHGRGFAVVADEVRKLAERSQRETRTITDLINRVQLGTRQAVDAMSEGTAEVDAGERRAQQAGATLSEIHTAVGNTAERIVAIAGSARQLAGGARDVVAALTAIGVVAEENAAATEQLSAQSAQVGGAIGAIAAVSLQNSAAAEEVSASAEEMSAQVEEMSARAGELAATAQRLAVLTRRFRLATVTVTEAPPLPVRRAA